MKRRSFPWFRAARDFFFPYLPSQFVCALVDKYDFAFVAHPLILEDLSRQYPNLEGKNKKLLKFISKFLWPVLGSEITGFKSKAGKDIKGVVLFCPMSTRLLVLCRQLAARKLLKIIKIAEKLRVSIVGLGAYVPIVTYDGKLLAKRTHLNMTTGTCFSAIIAVQNALSLIKKCNIDKSQSTVAIVGAGGSVGSICVRLMMDSFDKFVLIDKKYESLNFLLSSDYLVNTSKKTLMLSNKIDDVKRANIVIVTTNTPGIIIRSEHLSPGTLVVDAAQPRNVSVKIPLVRDDVIVVESGVAVIPGLNTNFKFALGDHNEVYSCLAEVLILLWAGMNGKRVGKFDLDYIYLLQDLAREIGISLPQFRNKTGYVEERMFSNVSEALFKNSPHGLESLNGDKQDDFTFSDANRIIKLSV